MTAPLPAPLALHSAHMLCSVGVKHEVKFVLDSSKQADLCLSFNFHFIMHTVKIIRVHVHILPKPHINVLYFLNENKKRVVLYFEEN